jgi:NADH-quinone oxidoreductase subunit H
MAAAALWAVLPAAGLVLAGAVVAVAISAVLDTGAAGRPLTVRVQTPILEAARLFRQRRRRVVGADGVLRVLGCSLPLTIALLMALVVPFGGAPAANMSIGLVWFNAADVLLWAAWWLVGWGSNSAYALVGGYRFLAQALAYELPLMFSLTTTAVAAGSLDTAAIVDAQHDGWYVLQMPVAAVVYFAAVAAFATWGPFAHPGGVDAAGGLESELSGFDRLLLAVGRYALLSVGAAMGAALFLGGSAGPMLPGWLWSLVKTLAVLVMLMALRRFPVLAAERVMRIAWVFVLPATLAQVLITSVVAAGRA